MMEAFSASVDNQCDMFTLNQGKIAKRTKQQHDDAFSGLKYHTFYWQTQLSTPWFTKEQGQGTFKGSLKINFSLMGILEACWVHVASVSSVPTVLVPPWKIITYLLLCLRTVCKQLKKKIPTQKFPHHNDPMTTTSTTSPSSVHSGASLSCSKLLSWSLNWLIWSAFEILCDFICVISSCLRGFSSLHV